MLAKRYIVRSAIVLLLLLLLYLASKKTLIRERRLEKRAIGWFTYDDLSEQPVASFFDILPPTLSPSPEFSQPSDTLISILDFNKPVELDLQWASIDRNFTAEAFRFIRFIQSSKPLCPEFLTVSNLQFKVCKLLLSNLFPVYTFNIEQVEPFEIERRLLQYNSDLQIFVHNPNAAQLQVPDAFNFVFEPVALDDVDSPQARSHRWSRKTFASLRKKHGHEIISLAIISMNSAEWKILRNLLVSGEINRIAQLLVHVHMSWAGFGIAGDDAQVVHNWTEVLNGLMQAGFELVHSHELPGPKTLMGHAELFNSSCRYSLTFLRKSLLDKETVKQ